MAREDKTQILYAQALEFHEVVVRQRRQTRTPFAISLWNGHGRSNGTMLKRLADAAVRLKIDPQSREWKYLVQEGTSAAVGAALQQDNPERGGQHDPVADEDLGGTRRSSIAADAHLAR